MPAHHSRYPELTPPEGHISTTTTAVPTHSENEFSSNTNTFPEFFMRNKGLFILMISQLFFSLIELNTKILTASHNPATVPLLSVIMIQLGIIYICSQAFLFASGVADPILGPKDVRKLLVLRGISGFICIFGISYPLQYLSLPDVTALTLLIPIVTAILGSLFLGEPPSWKQGVAGFASLLGAILIAKPTFVFGESGCTPAGGGAGGLPLTGSEAKRMVALGLALIGVLAGACSFFTIRVIGNRAHPMHMMSYFSSWSVLLSVVAMLTTDTKWPPPIQWTWLTALIPMGIFGFFGQLLLTLGLQLETPSRGSIAFYTKIVFALILQRLVFGDSPSGLGLVGICMIMASAIYVAIDKPSMPTNVASTTAWDRNGSAEEARMLLADYDCGDPECNVGYGGVGRPA